MSRGSDCEKAQGPAPLRPEKYRAPLPKASALDPYILPPHHERCALTSENGSVSVTEANRGSLRSRSMGGLLMVLCFTTR